ncbi:riboflavin kinase / FMN adenylyltransferase [Chitinophaga ginsengisegetis]|uniref:Riboflavin biosynthesis protein n=1 Tax=Chitinophaga ginsengisegetis TaxID=393003 RepID=A0A1T5NZA1_9BACT|nr:bifunctional riboflavin kinase/FAD synthetase [Chitinophaga ginsengisegetis]MDR6567112.1 riboflavin kinase/FMN adenylyltransferase [Chitinophaga ginsengisegetis]MDR6646842.1 riboflavin kinase/FMN adenylyltransferase [Chitinophaga ginsengisegetis]MDR6653192.1 riboflavin kinase/FMN adenylyltransferase [Chitinophaga ginsengisegetis]SKD05623.1 riboflavin kinase / FMN adenylyltransferase [Chitinophaga ginsengisegetis]
MQVHRDLDHLPEFRNAIITIGTFDGVHAGHRFIIEQLEQAADTCGGETVIITFDPHPREVLQPKPNNIRLLTTLPEKIALLERAGIDHLVVVPFTKEFSEMPARSYLEDFLVARFKPHTIIIGYDHRFGHNREGGLELLEAEQQQYGFTLIEIPQQVVHDLTVSSTKIRKSLQEGGIRLANELLDYTYFLTGTVVHGDKMGRQLGYPTANLHLTDERKLIPAEGIYAVNAQLSGRSELLPAVMSIGFRPTFNGTDLRLEVHIFDFKEDIYGQELTVHFVEYIRSNLKFDNIDALIVQMDKDSAQAKEILAKI